MNSHPVEPKVKWSSLAAMTLSTLGLAAIGVANDANIISALPDWASMLAGAGITTLGTFLTGYRAAHQYRYGEDEPEEN